MRPTIDEDFHDLVASGSIPLSYRALANAFIQGKDAIMIKCNPRDHVRTYDDWCERIYPTKVPAKARHYAYHLPFTAAIQVITQTLGKEIANQWQKEYFLYLRVTNWILPYPQNGKSFHPYSDKEHGSKRPWQFFCQVNPKLDRDVHDEAQSGRD